MRFSFRLPRRLLPAPFARRLVAILGPDARSAGQSFAALGINSSTSLLAGAVLGSITGSFRQYPGLLIMMPAAIGLGGNVFSALGSRLSTAIHTGTYSHSLRRGSVGGDNIGAAIALTMALALILAVVTKAVAAAFNVEDTITVLDLAMISILGGLLAVPIVLGATLMLVAASVRNGWDLDNLVAPIVSALGGAVTVPSLWLATFVVGRGSWSIALGYLVVAVTVVAAVLAWRSPVERLRKISRESAMVLTVALVMSTLAGVVLQKQFETFTSYPALLVLVPAFVSTAGAFGGILASRLGTGLHLGTLQPIMVPSRLVRRDAWIFLLIAVPVYAFNGLGAHAVSWALGVSSPGAATMVAVSLLGALGGMLFVIALAYYTSIAAFRLGADPDTYAIPVVTSSVDFIGSIMLITAIAALGVG